MQYPCFCMMPLIHKKWEMMSIKTIIITNLPVPLPINETLHNNINPRPYILWFIQESQYIKSNKVNLKRKTLQKTRVRIRQYYRFLSGKNKTQILLIQLVKRIAFIQMILLECPNLDFWEDYNPGFINFPFHGLN